MTLINIFLILTAISGVLFVYWLEFRVSDRWSSNLRFHQPAPKPIMKLNPSVVISNSSTVPIVSIPVLVSDQKFGVWLPDGSEISGYKVDGSWVASVLGKQPQKCFRMTKTDAEKIKQEFQYAYPTINYAVREHADNCSGVGSKCCSPKT